MPPRIHVGNNEFMYANRNVYAGNSPLWGIYVGDTLIWRQFKNVSTNVAQYQNGHNAGWTTRYQWTVDGWGYVDVSVQHSWGSNILHWTPDDRGIRLLHNGNEVVKQKDTYTTSDWNSTLNATNCLFQHGDVVAIQTFGNSAVYTEGRRVTINSLTATLRSA